MTTTATRECSLRGCSRARKSKGWCQTHYSRWLRTGTTEKRQRTTNVEGRLFKRILVSDTGCLIWVGDISNSGYGLFGIYGKTVSAHRFVYERVNGPIPEGLQLDHLCRVRECVNPRHLEPVTASTNIQRAVIYKPVKRYCQHGHRYTKANTYRRSNGKPVCRICHRIRAWNQRHPGDPICTGCDQRGCDGRCMKFDEVKA